MDELDTLAISELNKAKAYILSLELHNEISISKSNRLKEIIQKAQAYIIERYGESDAGI